MSRVNARRSTHPVVVHHLTVAPQHQHVAQRVVAYPALHVATHPALHHVSAPLRVMETCESHDGARLVVGVHVAVGAALRQRGLELAQSGVRQHALALAVFYSSSLHLHTTLDALVQQRGALVAQRGAVEIAADHRRANGGLPLGVLLRHAHHATCY